ncbi:hypothetical protein [Massilia sp. YMA4]|uniref:hypothetical protein n=1 Tax=Massilia sp. YMA4 TaxID=1593482 RepID=UPI000DD131FA|nr:hypothetical protein [Massilia sp. YMA4]AXA90828.1 hypothetical protein DPH57_06415 [Massilia sp. YMA4]
MMAKAMQKRGQAVTPRARATAPAAEVRDAKAVRGGRVISRPPASLRATAGQKLLASTGRLAQAVSKFAVTARAGAEPPAAGEFQNAYASIIKLLPKQTRLQVLQAMRQGIDEVVRAESRGTSAAQEKRKGVSTADFMAGLRQQEETQRQHQVAKGELLPGREMQRLLGITPQALSAAMKRKRIFALKGTSGKYLYPSFFADSAYDRATLERICQALGDLPGSTKLHFFTSPRLSLGGFTPLQAVAKGKVDAVLDQANAMREA